jgi:hypothetical protein
MINQRVPKYAYLALYIFLTATGLLVGCEPSPSFESTTTPSHAPEDSTTSVPASTQSSVQVNSSPVGPGSPLPASQLIDPVNVDQIELLASIPDYPERLYRLSSDQEWLFVADTHGIDVININSNTVERRLPFGVVYNTSPDVLDPSGINESQFSISAHGDVLAFIDFQGVKVITREGTLLFSSALEIPLSPVLPPRSVTSRVSLALSPDGEYLALSHSAADIDVIRLSDGESLETPSLVGIYPRFSPNGETLVIMNRTDLEFWETTNWTKIQEIPYRGNWPLFSFLDDSTILLHTWDNSLEVWGLDPGGKLRMIGLEGDPEMSILLAQPLSSPGGESFAVMKRDSGTPCFEYSPITVTVFNLDGELLSEQETPFESRNCKPYFLGLGYVSAPIHLLDSGEVVFVAPPSSENPWDPRILQAAESTPAPDGLPPVVEAYLRQQWSGFEYAYVLSPDGRYAVLALGKDLGSAMVIYDVLLDDPLYWGSAAFTTGSFSPDGSLFAMTLGNTIHWIDLSSSQDLQFVPLYADPRLVPDAPLAISPDRGILAAVIARDALGETLGFISLNDGALLYQLPVGNDEIRALRFSEDGQFLIASTFGGWTDILAVEP